MTRTTPHSRLVPGAFLISLALIASTETYRDVHERFVVQVEAGWRLTPSFGDLHGTTFRKDIVLADGRSHVELTVHADPVPASTLAEFARRVEDRISTGRELEAQAAQKARLGGRAIRVRSFIPKQRGSESPQIRSYTFEENEHFYHLFAVGPQAAMRTLTPEIDRMVGSFAPSKAQPEAPEPEAPKPEPAVEIDLESLVGHWQGKGGALLVVSLDGSFSLGKASGRYALSGDLLELQIPNKPKRRFKVRIASRETLILAAEKLERPVIYRRRTDLDVAGKWQAEASGKPLLLILDPSGRFQFLDIAGMWGLEDGQLVIAKKEGQQLRYDFAYRADRLVLSGGDLGEPLRFRRVRAR